MNIQPEQHKQELQTDLHKLKEELVLRQRYLQLKQQLIEKRIHNIESKRAKIQPKRANTNSKTTVNTTNTDTTSRSSHRLLKKCLYNNRLVYAYKNPIEIGGSKYVSVDGGHALALVDLEGGKTTGFDDLPLWIEYHGKKYVKNFTGKYSLQRKDWDNSQPQRTPCIFFTRTGKCPRSSVSHTYLHPGQCSNRSCHYTHLPDHIALCPNILTNRSCSRPNCHLSHTPTQFNAPTCKFFQNGACNNANCVYSHKLEVSDAPICREFALNGYCDLGRKCPLRHILDCPDVFDYGYCPRGRSCRLNHSINRSKKAGPVDPMKPIRNADNDDVVLLIDDNDGVREDVMESDDDSMKQATDTQLADNVDYVPL